MSRGPWVKLYERSLRNPRLRRMPPALRCAWYEWLLVAGPTAGQVRQPTKEQADLMKIPPASLGKAFALLAEDRGDDQDEPMIRGTVEDFELVNYADHQRKPSETPEEWRERQRKARRKKSRRAA